MGEPPLRPAVFLDRDGVLNEAVVRDGRPYPPTIGELRVVAGAASCLQALSSAGFDLIVVTNQPDIARGTRTRGEIEEIHRRLADELPVDSFYVCAHDDADGCDCRKPLPGLLNKAARDRDIDLARSYFIGDRWKDVDAGRAAGVGTVFVDRAYTEPRPNPPADVTVSGLEGAVAWILKRAQMRLVDEEPWISRLNSLHVKLFADGADLASIRAFAANSRIAGFTTNPTLMRKAGVTDYRSFAKAAIEIVGERPISFEVLGDDAAEMERHARVIAAWAPNVYVKIPVTNTAGISTAPLVRRLSSEGVRLNVTALMTPAQVRDVTAALAGGAPAYVSLFAGRVADTGRDPLPILRESVAIMSEQPQLELIWASPRELLNIVQADEVGCHIITATSDILAKLELIEKDLDDYSLETVKMFDRDGRASGYVL